MTTREYKSYKRMTKMTVRFLENHESNLDSLKAAAAAAAATTSLTKSSIAASATSDNDQLLSLRAHTQDFLDKPKIVSLPIVKTEATPTQADTNGTNLKEEEMQGNYKEKKPEIGRYTNWTSQHTTLASLAWCCIGDLMAFCDKYEFRTINRNDLQMHNRIVAEIKSLLSGPAPFDMRKRFPADIRSPENLWVCIGRCTGVEYHLNRMLSVFRKPMDKLTAEKQRMLRHDFHLAVNELRLDISARISDVRLYDRNVFEREFRLEWQDETPSDK